MKARIDKIGDRRGFTADAENIEQVRATLAKADQRIATLESKLREKQATIKRLLSDDARSNEELANLKEMISLNHSSRSAFCECDICTEVERSHAELRGST